jgi:hypothetical protein
MTISQNGDRRSGLFKSPKEETQEPFLARMRKNLTISESEEGL